VNGEIMQTKVKRYIMYVLTNRNVTDLFMLKRKDNLKIQNDDEDMKNSITKQDIKILSDVRRLLKKAADVQPCPGCKHDIEQLEKFVGEKKDALENEKLVNKKTAELLKEVDFVNELTDIAIVVSRIIKPFVRIRKIPEIYEKVLRDDMNANRTVRKYLVDAYEDICKLERRDKHYMLMKDVVASFIRATEFKLSVDKYTFYIFDKTIKWGYKTHLLSATSKIIVGIKCILNPWRYE
jgi:hypothetical protein